MATPLRQVEDARRQALWVQAVTVLLFAELEFIGLRRADVVSSA